MKKSWLKEHLKLVTAIDLVREITIVSALHNRQIEFSSKPGQVENAWRHVHKGQLGKECNEVLPKLWNLWIRANYSARKRQLRAARNSRGGSLDRVMAKTFFSAFSSGQQFESCRRVKRQVDFEWLVQSPQFCCTNRTVIRIIAKTFFKFAPAFFHRLVRTCFKRKPFWNCNMRGTFRIPVWRGFTVTWTLLYRVFHLMKRHCSWLNWGIIHRIYEEQRQCRVLPWRRRAPGVIYSQRSRNEVAIWCASRHAFAFCLKL